MPCYVNPNAAKHEKEMCEMQWRFFQMVRDAEDKGFQFNAKNSQMISEMKVNYLKHRKEDRDFLVKFLENRNRPGDKEIITNVLAMPDDELIYTYWGTWENQQMSEGLYRGQEMSLSAHPDPHRSTQAMISV